MVRSPEQACEATHMSGLTISRAAKAAGVGVETIRFYERKRLIQQPPKPAGGGFRVYPENTVRRIQFIRAAQSAGFSLREAAELLSLCADSGADCASIRGRAQATLSEVNKRLERLHWIQRSLTNLIAACPGQGPLRECSIIRALEGGSLASGQPQKELPART